MRYFDEVKVLFLKGARPKHVKYSNYYCTLIEQNVINEGNCAHLDMRDQQDGCRSEQGQQTQKIKVSQN